MLGIFYQLEKGDVLTSKLTVQTSEGTIGSIFHVSVRSSKVPGVGATLDVTFMGEILKYVIERRPCFDPGPKPLFSRPQVFIFIGTEKNGNVRRTR